MNPQPVDPKMEQAVLGSCMLDPDAIVKAIPVINPADFYFEKNRWIYESMLEIHDRHDPVDFTNLVSELERNKKIELVGGTAYLASLMNLDGSAFHVESYARQLADLSGKRRILSAACSIAEICANGKGYEEAHSLAMHELLKAAPKATSRFMSSEESVGDLIITLRLRMDEPVEVSGLRTGYADWDNKFGGLLPGLHIIEGRTSIGKTWLALGIAEGVAGEGIPVAFISLEMSGEQINLRRISRFSQMLQVQLRTGYIFEDGKKRKFNTSEVERVERAASRAMDHPIFVSSDHFSTSSQVIAKLTRMKAEHGIGLAVVDYIQKFRDRAEREEKALGDAAHNLKDCADSLGIPLVVLSQVNRVGNQRDTRFLELGDTRGSGQIEEAADEMFAITSEDYGKSNNPNYKRKNVVEVSNLKGRLSGAAGKVVRLAVVERIGSIENLAE